MANGQLEGRVAIVTGAASGIGAGAALEFVKQGAKVCVQQCSLSCGASSTIDTRARCTSLNTARTAVLFLCHVITGRIRLLWSCAELYKTQDMI